MTASAAITRVTHGDAAAAGMLAIYCRFKLRMDYAETLAFIRRRTGVKISGATWDALLQQCEAEESRE